MQELDNMVEMLEKIALVKLVQKRSIISLIGNVQRSSLILEKVSRTWGERQLLPFFFTPFSPSHLCCRLPASATPQCRCTPPSFQ